MINKNEKPASAGGSAYLLSEYVTEKRAKLGDDMGENGELINQVQDENNIIKDILQHLMQCGYTNIVKN